MTLTLSLILFLSAMMSCASVDEKLEKRPQFSSPAHSMGNLLTKKGNDNHDRSSSTLWRFNMLISHVYLQLVDTYNFQRVPEIHPGE